MEFLGTTFMMAVIAGAILVILGVVWLLYGGGPTIFMLPRTRRHYNHTYHQTWWKGIKHARKLIHGDPVQVGDSYFWEDDECVVRLDHEGMDAGYEGSLTIRQKRSDVGGAETIVYHHGRGYGFNHGAHGHIFKIAQKTADLESWVLRDILWPLYFVATRKALVT